MVKKRTSFILAFLLTLFLIIVPSFTIVKGDSSTSNVTISFELRINDKNVVLANQDDIVNVDFIIKRIDCDESYTTNGFQNEIYFDREVFDFVENSIVCYDTGMPTAKYKDNIEHGKIIQCANMSNTYPAEFKFCSFQLKAIKDNVSGMVYNDNQQIYDLEHKPIPFAEKNLKVMVGIDCEHITKTTFIQKPSTCVSQGYEAYQECTVCDALFNSNNELIAEITYFPLENHSGGTASCTKKAVCTVCGEEYGQLNQSSHSGAIVIINQKDATENEEGYTGDKICSHCNTIIEQGVAIPILKAYNGTITVNHFYNTTILTVGIFVIASLLLIIVILLIILCFKSNKPKEITVNLNGIKTLLLKDTSYSEENNREVVEEIAITDTSNVSQSTTKETNESSSETIELSENSESSFADITKKPFETKLAQASDSVKRYYKELKNSLLSFKKVKSRVSVKYDSVYVGRQQLVKFVIRGKSLYLYLALDPKIFVGTKYNVSEIEQKRYLSTPCKYKVNGERKLVWAKELIMQLAKTYDLKPERT